MTDPDGDRVGLMVKGRDNEYYPLTGNEGAALLIDYIFSQRKEKGLLSKHGVMYSTIVSSSLGLDIAAYYGVECEQFLTGFKFIGDRIQHHLENNGPTFEFGYEESYGCLVAPFVRDKDGLQAILLYSEMALYYQHQGKNLLEVFDELQQRFDYHADIVTSIEFFGPQGAKEMEELMNKLQYKTPTTIASRKVTRVEDYDLGIAKENGVETKLTLPKSKVVKLFLDDNSTVAVRPSGTEPKCKFYVGAVSKNKEEVKLAAKEIFDDLMKYLKD